MPPIAPSLWRNRSFNVYWSGQALSVLGDAFASIATPLLMLQATGSVLKMGLVTAANGVGTIAAGIFSGLLVDRLDRRRLMISCDVARALLWSIVPLTWWLFGPRPWVIYLIAALGGFVGNTFQVACITAVASLVRRESIIDANGRLHATYAAMHLIGPMLAGVVCHRFGPEWAIAINAASFLASALSLVFVRLRRRAPAVAVARESLLAELSAGLRFLVRDPGMRSFTLLIAGSNLLYAGKGDVLIYHLKHALHGNDGNVGSFFGIASAGAVLGALTAPRLRRRLGLGTWWIACGLVAGLALTGLSLAPTLGVAALVMVWASFADASRGVLAQTYRQEVVPEHMLGRVTAAFWMVLTTPQPLGAVMMTGLAARVGTAPTLGIAGLGMLALSCLALATPLRAATDARHRPAATS